MNHGSRTGAKKFMIFKLGSDRYATPLYQVKEVIGLMKTTPIPCAQEYFKGMINLRGCVVSILDLRVKFGISIEESAEARSCIIISEINEVVIGAVVDDVIEVVSLEDDQIESHLSISRKVNNDCIIGVIKSETKDLTVLLDIKKVLNVDEVDSVRKQLAGIRAA